MEWQDGLNAITGALTALFTGLSVWLIWHQQRDRITAEWDFSYSSVPEAKGPSRIWVRGSIRNGTGSTLKVWRIDVKGPVIAVEPNGKEEKHSSWAASALPLHCEPAPGATASFSAMVTPDWVKIHAQQQRWAARAWTWFARRVWKLSSSSIRVHHGASLHFQITIDSKSNRRFRRRMEETMNITPEMAEKNAAIAAIQKAVTDASPSG